MLSKRPISVPLILPETFNHHSSINESNDKLAILIIHLFGGKDLLFCVLLKFTSPVASFYRGVLLVPDIVCFLTLKDSPS